ncbi:MAG: terminase small subunit [Oscillospiraceae bacterium]|nr:terminase small subunit [Oscillospiraceae bacterium]
MENNITKEMILNEICAIAFSDYTEFVRAEEDEDGGTSVYVVPSHRLTKAQKAAVSMIKAGTRGVELKLYDKLKALELLARLTGVFEADDDELEELRRILQNDDDEDG